MKQIKINQYGTSDNFSSVTQYFTINEAECLDNLFDAGRDDNFTAEDIPDLPIGYLIETMREVIQHHKNEATQHDKDYVNCSTILSKLELIISIGIVD